MSTEIQEDDEEEEMILTSKLQLVSAAKSRKLQYISSPVISHHVSLSLLSSPDDLSHSRASVPFSWEEEPGKPKHHTLLLRGAPHDCPKRLHLPPRLLLPDEVTKMHLASDHPHHLAAALKRWFRWKKDRADDDDVTGKCSFALSADNGDDKKIKRTASSLHCLSDVARCYLWEIPWKKNKLKRDDVFINCH
ncbi:unnamed protein product [Eruca vesicaria subsp. sativa]|uniref:Uncharacterized protein n=1 Tax=Eruca vesicaria subsp. sativa TaxID=29727 RepID=A0ABC8L4Y0_ERUVS|nr:unnamed protein product [Eruca vesicaria subsp. sativa]